jgi:glycosyltransferase involved in cell wall biosynthesis
MKEKTKITFILPSLAGGGAQRVILNLIKNIDKSKFVLELILFNKTGPLVDFLPNDISVVSLGKNRLRSAFCLLIKQIRSTEPDVIFSTLPHVNIALIAARILLPGKSKIIIREANTSSKTIKLTNYGWLIRFLYKSLYKSADAVVALSNVMERELSNKFSVPLKKMSIIYNPVDEITIRKSIKKIRRTKDEEINYVCSGRLIKQKGFDRLIKAVIDFPLKSHLTVMGEGPELEALKSIISEYKLQSKVTFIGFQKNPWEWYAGADALLMSSHWEGMSNSVLEALACGCPVIATPESGGIADVKMFSESNDVTIAGFYDDFIQAVNNINKKNEQKLVGDSLLPKEFKLDYAVSEYQKLFSSQVVMNER